MHLYQVANGGRLRVFFYCVTVLVLFGSSPHVWSVHSSSSPKQDQSSIEPVDHQTEVRDDNKLTVSRQSSATSTSIKSNNHRRFKKVGECEYVKGPWDECQSNGVQRRTLRLKEDAARERPDSISQCEPIKTIDRECKLVGCKYARGEWSSSCEAGKRSRVDTLLGILGSSNGAARDGISRCPAKRTVSKDCSRACHYIKSAWSECINGFKTRNLTLDSSPFGADAAGTKDDDRPAVRQPWNKMETPNGCVKKRLIRRPCSSTYSDKPVSGNSTTASKQRHPGSKSLAGAKMNTPQKRRLQKQQKLLQQQQQQKAAANSSTRGSKAPERSNGLTRRR